MLPQYCTTLHKVAISVLHNTLRDVQIAQCGDSTCMLIITLKAVIQQRQLSKAKMFKSTINDER